MRFTVKAKLASAFAVVILLSMVASDVAYIKLSDLIGASEALAASAGRIEKAANLQKEILMQIRAEKNAILAPTEADTDRIAGDIVNLRGAFVKKRDELYGLASDAGKKMIDKLSAAYLRMASAQDESIRLAKVNRARAAAHSASEVRKAGGGAGAGGGGGGAGGGGRGAGRAERARDD